MQKIPDRLISNSYKVNQIRQIISDQCILLRRTESYEYLTQYDEIDVEIIKDIDLFNMSSNILLCKRDESGIENKIKDVNIVFHEVENKPFFEDSQLTQFNLDEIKVEHKETLILGFQKSILEGIKGPYKKGLGTKDEEDLNYEIIVKYDPYVLNCFHMESEIRCTESDEEIERKKITGFRKAIASDIKVKLMNKKQIIIFNYDDINE